MGVATDTILRLQDEVANLEESFSGQSENLQEVYPEIKGRTRSNSINDRPTRKTSMSLSMPRSSSALDLHSLLARGAMNQAALRRNSAPRRSRASSLVFNEGTDFSFGRTARRISGSGMKRSPSQTFSIASMHTCNPSRTRHLSRQSDGRGTHDKRHRRNKIRDRTKSSKRAPHIKRTTNAQMLIRGAQIPKWIEIRPNNTMARQVYLSSRHHVDDPEEPLMPLHELAGVLSRNLDKAIHDGAFEARDRRKVAMDLKRAHFGEGTETISTASMTTTCETVTGFLGTSVSCQNLTLLRSRQPRQS